MMDWKTKKRSGAGPVPARGTVSEGRAEAAWTVAPLPTSAVVSAVPWCPVLALSAGRRLSPCIPPCARACCVPAETQAERALSNTSQGGWGVCQEKVTKQAEALRAPAPLKLRSRSVAEAEPPLGVLACSSKDCPEPLCLGCGGLRAQLRRFSPRAGIFGLKRSKNRWHS